jgi:hypothetical protein
MEIVCRSAYHKRQRSDDKEFYDQQLFFFRSNDLMSMAVKCQASVDDHDISGHCTTLAEIE